MIIAKLNPGISIIKQESPFEAPVSITYDWMTVFIPRYIPGAANFNVNLSYGDAVMNDEPTPAPKKFRGVKAISVGLTAGEISNWGTNDVVLLEILATKMNLTIEKTYEIDDDI
jgi:hypothetical protein